MTDVQEALKAAIEFIENVFEGEWNWPFSADSKIKSKELLLETLNAAIAEIDKCEPVAYLSDVLHLAYMADEVLPEDIPRFTPLFTSPISKAWVDVPYEERRDLYKSLSKGNIDGFADLLSAKLKQLNFPEKG